MHVGDVPTNNKAPTHNHLIDSDEGLALETSPSQFSYGRGGSRGSAHPLLAYFYTKLRSEGPKKVFFEAAPPPLSQGIDDRAPLPPYLKVWICHCPMPYLPYQANQVFVSLLKQPSLLATRCKGRFARRDVSASATEIPY